MYSDISDDEITHKSDRRHNKHDHRVRTSEKHDKRFKPYSHQNTRDPIRHERIDERLMAYSQNKKHNEQKSPIEIHSRENDNRSPPRSKSHHKHRRHHHHHHKHKHSRHDRKHHRKTPSPRKEHSRDEKRHKRSKSIDKHHMNSSFINEILLNNESAKDVVVKDSSILKNVINAVKNDIDSNNNNNMEISYTPPLPVEKKKAIDTIDCKPKEPEKSEKPVDNNCKKKGILDLPMPPLVELKPIVSHPKIKFQIKAETKIKMMEDKEKEKLIAAQCWENKYQKLNEDVVNKEHKEEMKNHLKRNSSILTPSCTATTPPEVPIKRPRPTVIGKEKNQNKMSFPNHQMETFSIIEQVGEGTYGKVYKAVNVIDKKIVAMKLIRMENEHQGFPITCLREIKNLQALKHQNIIELQDVVFDSKKVRTYLVFEFMNHDLLGLMNNPEMRFSEGNIYRIISQVLEGLQFCHDAQIIHRDLKSSNILINNEGIVKLADFGLSRNWMPERPFTNKVISLWYRPIELLLGEEQYTPVVDIWSVGCIMAELFKRSPLFPFSDEIDIVDAIFRLCGTPNKNSWPEATNLPRFRALIHKHPGNRVLRETLSTLIPPCAIDLVDRMLTLNPKRRITAKEALDTNWIKANREKQLEPLKLPSMDCFEFRFKYGHRVKKKQQ